MFIVMSNCCLFFIVSGIQYWATYYFVHILKAPESKGNIGFATVAITAPVAGVLASGFITDRLGGFYSPKILPTVVILLCVIVMTAVPAPFFDSVSVVVALIWCLLFFGAIVLPMCTGVMFTKVEPEMRPRANSVANIYA